MSANRKAILIVGPEPPALTGGIASFVGFQLASPLLNEKYRLLCLDTSLNPGLRKGAVRRAAGAALLAWRLLKTLIGQRPAVVHIHSASFLSFWEKALLLMICRCLGRRTVLHVHGAMFDSFYKRSALKTLIRMVLNRADAVIVLTSYWREFFSSITRTRLEIVPNCPRELFFEPGQQDSHGEAVVYTGDVGRRKGADVLLEAVAILRGRGLHNQVILAGGEEQPGDIDYFHGVAADRDIGNLDFRGNVGPEELKELLEEAALFCLPSRAEGLPIAILEAMAAGLPVVSTPVGGIPDAIEEGVNGYLVPVGDCEALADKLELLLRDSALREKISVANHQKARASYHPRVTAQALAALYDSLAG